MSLFSLTKKLKFANQALQLNGLSTVENLYTGNSEREKVVSNIVDSAIETTLAEAKYNISTVEEDLRAYSDVEGGYYIPDKLIRIVGIRAGCSCFGCGTSENAPVIDPAFIFLVKNGRFYLVSVSCSCCSCDTGHKIIYTTADIHDGLITPAIERACTSLIAKDLALHYTSSITRADFFTKEYNMWILKSLSHEAQDYKGYSEPHLPFKQRCRGRI